MHTLRTWSAVFGCAVSACQNPAAVASAEIVTGRSVPATPSQSSTAIMPRVAAPKHVAEAPAQGRAPSEPTADRLQELYEKQPKTRATMRCDVEPTRTKVSEISIERTACFGDCPVYSLTLHADGAVEYYGDASAEPLGAHHGKIDTDYFDQLARLAEDIGWFGLGSNYACHVTDNPTTYTSLVRAGARKTIRHHAPTMSGPPRLYFFERTLDDYRRFIAWSD